MANVTNIKPLVKEDYPGKYHELVDKLSFSLNPFMRQVVDAFSGQSDFTNLTFETLSFTLTVDSSGVPTAPLLLKVSPSRKLKGFICVYAENRTDTTATTNTPFLTFNVNGNIATVTRVTGLPASKKYALTVIAIR